MDRKLLKTQAKEVLKKHYVKLLGFTFITVVLGLNGAGDNGYNDEILAGIMDVNETNEVRLSSSRLPSSNRYRRVKSLQMCKSILI